MWTGKISFHSTLNSSKRMWVHPSIINALWSFNEQDKFSDPKLSPFQCLWNGVSTHINGLVNRSSTPSSMKSYIQIRFYRPIFISTTIFSIKQMPHTMSQSFSLPCEANIDFCWIDDVAGGHHRLRRGRHGYHWFHSHYWKVIKTGLLCTQYRYGISLSHKYNNA